MSDSRTETTQRNASESWLTFIALFAVALPPLYVLSCGPLAWVADRTGGDWYDTLFAPIIWLYERFPTLQPWIDRYIDWWT